MLPTMAVILAERNTAVSCWKLGSDPYGRSGNSSAYISLHGCSGLLICRNPRPHGLLVVLGGDGVRAERDEDGEEDGDEEACGAAGQYGVQMGGVQQELVQPAL